MGNYFVFSCFNLDVGTLTTTKNKKITLSSSFFPVIFSLFLRFPNFHFGNMMDTWAHSTRELAWSPCRGLLAIMNPDTLHVHPLNPVNVEIWRGRAADFHAWTLTHRRPARPGSMTRSAVSCQHFRRDKVLFSPQTIFCQRIFYS